MTGKEKCEFLRTIRMNMAAKNGIPYTPKECTNEGDCWGTCPLCEYETKILMEKLQAKIDKEGSLVIDSDSIDKLERLGKPQTTEPQIDGESNVVDLHPTEEQQRYSYTRLTGDVSDEDGELHIEPKRTSTWQEIKEIVRLLSLFPRAIYKYFTTKAKRVKINDHRT